MSILHHYKIRHILVVLATLAVMGYQNCSNQNSSTSANSAVTPSVPMSSDNVKYYVPNVHGFDFDEVGATTKFTIDSLEKINSLLETPIRNPTDVKISLKFKNVGSSELGKNITPGQVIVSFRENDQMSVFGFITHDTVIPTGLSNSDEHHAIYNTWFLYNGGLHFHGFYQGDFGVVLIVLHDNGGGTSAYDGGLWYKPFPNLSTDECGYSKDSDNWRKGNETCPSLWDVPSWFRNVGPYDGRTFLVKSVDGVGEIKTDSALYPHQSIFFTSALVNPYVASEPSRGYVRLGTFRLSSDPFITGH